MLYFLAVSMLVTVLGVLADGSSSSSTGSQFLHDRPGPDLNPLSSSTDGSTSEVLTAVEAGPPFSGSGTQRSSQTSTKDITVTVKSTTIVESTRTAVMTTPPTRATSHSTSAPATQPPGLPMCWTIGGCAPVVDDLTAAYAFSGQLIDPNDRGQNPARDPNRLFQMNFCQNSNYKDVIYEGIAGISTHMYACVQCFRLNSIDTDTLSTPTMNFLWKVHDFCHTNQPSLYDLLDHVLTFMKSFSAPTNLDNMPEQMTALVDSLRSQFTWTSGMNQATDQPASSWWQTSLRPDGPIPTEYLAQIPRNWPYTEYGVARKAGKVTSWPFVNPNATSQTVAWLFHSMLPNPRPLFTPKAMIAALNGSAYNPLLKNWRHSFIYDTVTYTPTPTPTSTPRTTMPEPARTPFSQISPQALVGPIDPGNDDGRIRASTNSQPDVEGSNTGSVGVVRITSASAQITPNADAMLRKFVELMENLE